MAYHLLNNYSVWLAFVVLVQQPTGLSHLPLSREGEGPGAPEPPKPPPAHRLELITGVVAYHPVGGGNLVNAHTPTVAMNLLTNGHRCLVLIKELQCLVSSCVLNVSLGPCE